MHHDQPDGASLPRGDLPTADGHPDLPLYQASALADTDEIQRSLSEAATQDAQRVTEDAAAYDMLAAANFSGIAWELMADTLAAYAYPVAMNWLYTGEIVTLCAARQRPVTRTPHDWDALTADRDEREELVCETIARALRTFREHALIKGRWSPKGGASLKTYFIGAVLGEFSAVYSRWASERSRRPPCIPDGMESLQALPADHRTTEDEIIGRAAVRTFLVGITDETTRTAVVLSMMGYSRQEVGEHLNMSAAAVTMRLSRLRRKRPPHQSSPPPESPDPSTDKEARG